MWPRKRAASLDRFLVWSSLMGKEKVFLTLHPLYTTDAQLSGRISKSMSEHYLERVQRTEA